jgi:hypothetical protein
MSIDYNTYLGPFVLVYNPPQPGATVNVAEVKADLAAKGLVWTSMFGDA